MTVRDQKLVDLLRCAADVCLSRPDLDWCSALMIAADDDQAMANLAVKEINRILHNWNWNTPTGKGYSCLEAARQIEEQRGILR